MVTDYNVRAGLTMCNYVVIIQSEEFFQTFVNHTQLLYSKRITFIDLKY